MVEQLGIRKGDRLIIILPRLPAWWEILLGAIRLGAIVIPCTTLLTSKDIEYRLRASRAKVFISDVVGAEKFNTISDVADVRKIVVGIGHADAKLEDWHSFHDDVEATTKLNDRFYGVQTLAKDPCIIYFTSGTSGFPKMVLHNQISYPLGSVITGRHWYRLSPGKVFWSISELGWAKAAWSTFGCWSMGATLFIQDDRGSFSPERLLYNLHKYDITTLCAPPTAFRQLVLKESLDIIQKHKPRTLECCVAAGEALNPYVINTWKQTTGLDIFEGYGQTETVLLCGNTGEWEVRPGSMGKAVPGIPLSLVDDSGNELPPDIEGNIAVRTTPRIPWMFDGYLQEDNSLVFPEVVDPKTGNRWYVTGDRATRDREGYFWFVGRADDVINTAGYRVGPFELESTLKEHPGILESAVVGTPDPERGEVVKAFIVLTDQYRTIEPAQLVKDILDFVTRNTAPYKKPREIEFVESLPKTISGKVRHVELRARERLKKAKSLETPAKL
ncbi:acetyl-coenzyme A synthetase family protein [Ramaria rubella]|nr:acetyl-coenzyme A synthetase family protein [Ramaria rubella]